MKRFKATDEVSSGRYLSLSAWEFVQVNQGERLSGDGDFIKVSDPAYFFLLPAIGFLYWIFFPAIIFYGVLSIIFKKAFAPVKTVFQSLFGYRYMPGVSGITGSGKKANGKKERGEEKGVKEGDKP